MARQASLLYKGRSAREWGMLAEKMSAKLAGLSKLNEMAIGFAAEEATVETTVKTGAKQTRKSPQVASESTEAPRRRGRPRKVQ